MRSFLIFPHLRDRPSAWTPTAEGVSAAATADFSGRSGYSDRPASRQLRQLADGALELLQIGLRTEKPIDQGEKQSQGHRAGGDHQQTALACPPPNRQADD